MDLNKKIEEKSKKIKEIYGELDKLIIGQRILIRDMLIALFSSGHILLEWAPWLAKTLSAESLANIVSLDFNRIQFTPDLLPSDLIGSRIYNPESKEFFVKKWPVFSNLILADEINRAPSKVQSALLEAMAERQVTIWDKSFKLEEPFMVLATANPIEQDWTYNLPEAQLDRFLIKTVISYPSQEEEIEIVKNNLLEVPKKLSKVLTKKDILDIRKLVSEIFVSDNILEYVRDIVFATRDDDRFKNLIFYWASPRASISMVRCAKVLAFLDWRDFVIPEDIKEIATSVLRHRIVLSYEAIADNIITDDIIENILSSIKVK